jgi:hypothetical protein
VWCGLCLLMLLCRYLLLPVCFGGCRRGVRGLLSFSRILAETELRCFGWDRFLRSLRRGHRPGVMNRVATALPLLSLRAMMGAAAQAFTSTALVATGLALLRALRHYGRRPPATSTLRREVVPSGGRRSIAPPPAACATEAASVLGRTRFPSKK